MVEARVQEIGAKLIKLKDELKIGSFICRKYTRVYFLHLDSNKTDSWFQFSKIGEGAFGQCFFVTPREEAPENLASLGNFLVKKLKESTDQSAIVEETARILLLTLMGHYGIVESHTIEYGGEIEKRPLVLIESDFSNPSQNMSVYITMKYIEGRQLSEAIEKKELNSYDKLRIAVRMADTMNFLHSYKLAHSDLSCGNIMLTQGTNDPILIDFGNMSTRDDFSILDTCGYHAMIYRMYRDGNVNEIPPAVRPMFDKWDDENQYQMPFKDITHKYFETLSAYPAMASAVVKVDSDQGASSDYSNTVPIKRIGGISIISIEAVNKSSSFTEYMEEVGISLAEQDKRIKKYLDDIDKTKTGSVSVVLMKD